MIFDFVSFYPFICLHYCEFTFKNGGKKINNQETVETAKSESFAPSLEMSKHENFRER